MPSGIAMELDLDKVPLSEAFQALFGDSQEARMVAATGGDDYQLLLTAPPETVLPIAVVQIGNCKLGQGLSLKDRDGPIQVPEKLGYVHS